MLNKKVEIKDTIKIGKGVFAKEKVSKGEIIADWFSGKVYHANKCRDLLPDIADHAIQFSEYEWIDVSGGRFINHSCESNCGFNGKFKLVSMRDILPSEQVTFDYDMSEDSDWRMSCKCGSNSCRKVIGSFKNLSKSFIDRYKGYISDWLVKKYKLEF